MHVHNISMLNKLVQKECMVIIIMPSWFSTTQDVQTHNDLDQAA